jgi:formylglycine-generating enzyme required for sulfatase activity/energy-coupling factor transporter ATP-binding protein EcfA2
MENKRVAHPYPGLRAFERSESRLFFGRQQQINDLLVRLKRHHFLAVLGTSGSGKSSLMKAGVLPKLEKGYMGEVGSRWCIAEMKPADQPFANLAAALLADNVFAAAWENALAPSPSPSGRGEENPATEPALSLGCSARGDDLADQLTQGARSLHDLLRRAPLPNGTRLLLLVDQFEELFRYRKAEADPATAFVALLLEASSHPDIYVAITMRSDFLGDAAEFHGLPEAINDGLYLTPRLSRDQLQDAICLPARLFGGTVEPELANHLLNQAGNDPDQLPLLQHALMRLWEADRQLTLTVFKTMGSLSGALDGHAELAYAELDTEQQRIAEILFRALTERAGDGQDIRRPISVGALLALAQCELPPLVAVINTFRQSGRNFLMPPPAVELTPDSVLDISHESLIRQWQKLQAWVKAEAESAAMYVRLLDAAIHHRELWRGTDLTLALEWEALAQPNVAWAARYGAQADFTHAIDFLRSSEAEAKRLAQAMLDLEQEVEAQRKAELKRTRRRMVLSLIGLLIALGLAGWALKAENTARKSQILTVEVTLDNLIKQKAGIESYLQGMTDQGQRAMLHTLLQPMLESSPSLNAQQKQDWQARLPNMTTERLTQLVRLLFAEKTDKKPNPADFATLAQEVALPLPKVSANEPEMLKISAGQFIMGCKEGRDSDCFDNEIPAHSVQIAAFELGKYEVTQDQWQAVMGDNPSWFKDCGGDCAVEAVSWDMVQVFIQRLNAKTGQHYRLPSEAEWEYACRAGKDTNYCGGNDAYAVAWYDQNGDRHPHAVGHKQPNAWGLRDMSGNVWEWVQDSQHDDYQGAPSDGRAWQEDAPVGRVLRGGSWYNFAQYLRAANRGYYVPSSRGNLDGFRLARTLP